MRLTVIGTGFVGVVTSAVFASFKNTVYGLDVDGEKIKSLQSGQVPFFEPGLAEMVKKGVEDGKLIYTTSYEEAISKSELILIAVGTPSAMDGTADLKYLIAACESLAPFLQEKTIVAIKSTVPPSTTTKVAKVIAGKTSVEFATAALPEFLREGNAVGDTLNPDRVVIGAKEDWVVKKLLKLHEPLKGEKVVVEPASAQMAKYTANAYLAQRITFINQIANLCEKNGAKISEVIKAVGFDKRVGTHYWYPGLGYGGSCFPKDVRELAAYSRGIGEGDGLLVKIDELNEQRIWKKLHQFDEAVAGFNGKKVAVLGLSFKPNTNDMREAPSLKIVPYLKEKGATVTGFDPKANGEAKKLMPKIEYAKSVREAIEGKDVVILLVEWEELSTIDPQILAKSMNTGGWLIDTRNQYSEEKIKGVGLNYLGIGNG